MPPPTNKPWKDAIVEVLKSQSAAMHYSDVAKEIVKRGLRKKIGATPAATVNVTIHQSITKYGENSPFVKVASGEFMLRYIPGKTNGKASVTKISVKSEDSETGGIIKAFGMFWRRDWVDWVMKPKLLGRQQEGADSVDFAGQHGVYLLHDGREVIYVGRTTETRLAARLSEHTRDRFNGRWDRFSWFGLLTVSQEGKLSKSPAKPITEEEVIITFEALLIEGLEPRQNRKRGDAFRAVEYLQAKDPVLDMKEKKKLIEEMVNKFKS